MDDINRLCEDLREDADWLDSIFPEQPDISDNRLTKRASLKLDRIAEAVREAATTIEALSRGRVEAMEEAARVADAFEKQSAILSYSMACRNIAAAIRALAQPPSCPPDSLCV